MFRSDPEYEVVAFTANQIPFISSRTYPKELSGELYPGGIRIYDETELPRLIKELDADISVLSYSDLPHNEVMQKASLVNACGSDFWLVAPKNTMLKSNKPVIAVCAVRTGAGKSPMTRHVGKLLRSLGKKAVIIRHPMPYGDLKKQVVQRFATVRDLDRYHTTIEEREDYEPHIRNRFVVYAGVDYARILKEAEKEADVIIWDGGNNDAPFYKPDLLITVADPLRAGNELTYYPGEIVARMADILVINKVNSATKSEVSKVKRNLSRINRDAQIVLAESIVSAENPRLIEGKRALLVEDGPTITHGNMRFGAATVAAKQYGAVEIVDAKQYAVGSIKDTYAKYPALGKELPAMGYTPKQIRDLEATLNKADCDVIISATPTNLRHLVKVNKPIVQVTYEVNLLDKRLDNAVRELATTNKYVKG